MFLKEDKEMMIKKTKEFIKNRYNKIFDKDYIDHQTMSFSFPLIISLGLTFIYPIFSFGVVAGYYFRKSMLEKLNNHLKKEKKSLDDLLNIVENSKQIDDLNHQIFDSKLNLNLKNELIDIFNKNLKKRNEILDKIDDKDAYNQLLNNPELYKEFSNIFDQFNELELDNHLLKNTRTQFFIKLNYQIKEANSLKQFELNRKKIEQIEEININHDDEIIVDRINFNHKQKL